MGIDFASLGNAPAAPAPTPAPAPVAMGGLSVDLTKNTVLDITKRNPGLKNITLAAGWDIAAQGKEFDLDLFAFLIGDTDKVTSTSDVIFFGNKTASGVSLAGDNRTGAGEGDDETMSVALDQVPDRIKRIVLCIDIYDAQNRRQTFGMVNNAYVRVLDKDNGDKQLCKYPLKDDYSTDTGIIVAELIRNGSEWDFHTIGEGKVADINGFLQMFS